MKSKKIITDIDNFLKEKEPELFSDLSELIAIPSVKAEPVGDKIFGKKCADVLEKALELGSRYGFETQNHEYYCGSLIFKSSDKPVYEIGIVTHLDIVPAGEGWTYNPFELIEKDGLYIGRGTEDDKGPTIAVLYALRYLKERGIKLPFAIRHIMGCDEETGMTDLPHYLEKMVPPAFSFTPDSDYPVCIGEKGIAGVEITLGELGDVIESISGGTASNAVPDSAQAVLKTTKDIPEDDLVSVERLSKDRIKLIAKGRAAHAAYPEGSINAIGVLAQKIFESGILNSDSDEYAAMKFLAEVLSDYYGAPLGINTSDKESGKLTCIGGIINSVDGEISLDINIRYPVTKRIGEVYGKLSETVEKYGYYSRLIYDKPPYYKNPESKEICALMDAYHSVTGKDDKPYTTGGGTYARAFPDCVAFGVALDECKGLLGEGKGGPHERDEYITKKEIFDSVKIFVLSMLNLAD